MAWAGIYEYIKLAFGVEAPIWTPDLTLFDNLTYYLSGPGGRAGLGAWLGLSIILLILISGIVFYKKNYWLFKRGLGFILIFILAYCIVTFAGIKSPFLGLVVPSLIIISSLYMMSYIINTFNEKKLYTLGNIICLTFAVWAIINWHTEYYSISGFPVVDQSFAAKQREAVKILVSEMKSDAKIGQRMLYEPIIAPYINEDNFFFALLSDGFYCPNANSSWRLTELSEQMKLFEKSDYAIIFSDNAIEPMPWIPSLKIRTQLREMVQSNSNFELISTAKLTADGEVYLYRNKFMK